MTERSLRTDGLDVGIASPAEMKERLLAAARGEYRPGPNEPKLWMAPEAWDAFMRAFKDTTPNKRLVELMALHRRLTQR